MKDFYYDENGDEIRADYGIPSDQVAKLTQPCESTASREFYYDSNGNAIRAEYGIPAGEDAIAPEIDIIDKTYRAITETPSEDKMDYGIPSKPDIESPIAIFESPEDVAQRLATEEIARKREIEAHAQSERIANISDAKNSATQLYYDLTGNVDFGIPSQENANRDRLVMERYRDDLQKQYTEYRNHIINNTQTEYVSSGQELPIEKIVVEGLEGKIDTKWAYQRLYHCGWEQTPENIKAMTILLEKVSEDPELSERLINSIFKDLNDIREQAYSAVNSRSLDLREEDRLANYLVMFAIMTERKLNFNLEKFQNIGLSTEFNGYYEGPFDVAVGLIVDTMEKRKGIGSRTTITNPINIISNTEGNDQMGIRELTNLILKARYTGHRLSDDKLNFPSSIILTEDAVAEFQGARAKQMEDDQEARNAKLEAATTKEEARKMLSETTYQDNPQNKTGGNGLK